MNLAVLNGEEETMKMLIRITRKNLTISPENSEMLSAYFHSHPEDFFFVFTVRDFRYLFELGFNEEQLSLAFF